MSATASTAPASSVYRIDPRFYDEAFEPGGAVRPHYGDVLAGLDGIDLDALTRQVGADLHSRGVRFGSSAGDRPFVIDPVPRLITASEWELLAAGLAQRVRALNAFIADAYGDGRIMEAGVVPRRVVDAAEHFEPEMAGIQASHSVWALVAGLDVVRGADGRFMVLEDNLRTPSGLAYMEAARDAMLERAPFPVPDALRSLKGTATALLDALQAEAPAGVDEPSVILLTDGPRNSAWYEHATLARLLGVPLLTLDDLDVRGGRVRARVDERWCPVDVIYRRTDEDRLVDATGAPTGVGEALLEPIRRGTIGCLNAFGTGVADDKLAHAYVEKMIRFYLGEDPLVPSVPTYDLSDPDCRAEALDRLDELVVKPRVGHGGHGVVICAHASPEDRTRIRRLVSADPGAFIAQETVAISRHPTVRHGRLEPRHVDLRPFVISGGDEVTVVPGGLTRVAFGAGALVVNTSQDGGGKDTWVLA